MHNADNVTIDIKPEQQSKLIEEDQILMIIKYCSAKKILSAIPLRHLAMKTNICCFSSQPIDSDDDFKPKPRQKIADGDAQKLIHKWVTQNDIVLFMKGTPSAPLCGYSNYVVQLLKIYGIFNFYSVNVLQDQVIRNQAKIYSKWPTFPQIYLKGQFVGGCDILSEMHNQNSLTQLLESKGIINNKKDQNPQNQTKMK